MIVQLAAYGVLWWLVFAGVAFLGARVGRIWGIVAGHFIIAAIILMLDERWLQSAMHSPGWNGIPDQDLVFVFGVLIRVVLVNTFLLPVSALGWMTRRRQQA